MPCHLILPTLRFPEEPLWRCFVSFNFLLRTSILSRMSTITSLSHLFLVISIVFYINLSLCLLDGSLSDSNASMISSIISACSLMSYTQGWSLAFTISSTFPFRRLSLAAPKKFFTFANVFLYFV